MRSSLLPGLTLAALTCWLVLSPATAAPAVHFANWQSQDGLPSNKIMAILQTRDGYVWIGTHEGLVRFDGVTFVRFDGSTVEALRDSSITNLFEAEDGTLWIGHPSGAVTALQRGRFVHHPPREGYRATEIKALAADAAGDIWVWDDRGDLARLRDGRLLQPAEGSAPGLRLMARSSDGDIWVTSRGTLSRVRRGELEVVPLAPGMSNYVHGICAARGGGLWAVVEGRLWKWKDGKWEGEYGQLSLGATPLHAFLELADGRLVAGTSDHGALVVTPSPFHEQQFWRATGFASDWILSLAQDHEGGLWIGTGGAGLFRTRHEAVEMLVSPDRWQGRSVLSVTPAAAGGYWVGTEGAGLYRYDGAAWHHYAREAEIRNPYIWTVTEDRAGQLWFGTWGGGLYQRTGERFELAPGFSPTPTPMKVILPRRAGGLWIGGRHGLIRYADGKAEWAEPENNRQLRDVRAIVEEEDGTVWVGCNGDGLGKLSQGVVQRFTRREGLPSDFIQSLHRDRDGVLWIGTRGAGLVRFKHGAFAPIDQQHGLSDGTICAIIEDRRGFMWLSSHRGIMRLAKEELTRCADGELERVSGLTFGLSDGLATLVSSGGLQPAACEAPDGRLVFATDRGLAVVNPDRIESNPRPPPVVIESVRVPGESVSGEIGSGKITVPAGARRIEIRYTGLSFPAPEKVRFRYRLDGLDTEWVEVGAERVAVYNHVPPGPYRFRVAACNNDNIWNETGASIAVTVLPFYWQTLWFRLLVLAGILLSTSGLVWYQARLRLKRTLERIERDRAVERERTRIAHDMHDDLGAHLTRITMLSDTARSEFANAARVQEGLALIYETARNVTRAMDEIVWAVNPKHDTLESLVYYFEKFALDLLGAAGLKCRLEMPSEFPDWQPRSEVRHNLFLAYKEALNNAVRHSGAKIVTVTIDMMNTGCRVELRDDGCGFTIEDARPTSQRDRINGGNGLSSMRERMSRIGGSCEVTSAPSRGTRIVLFAPAGPATADSSRGRGALAVS